MGRIKPGGEIEWGLWEKEGERHLIPREKLKPFKKYHHVSHECWCVPVMERDENGHPYWNHRMLQ